MLNNLGNYQRLEAKRKTRNGADCVRPLVLAENRRTTPPTDRQLQFIDRLVKELEENNIPYQYILDGTPDYVKTAGSASSVIARLRKLRPYKGNEAKYIVSCINIKTGERKRFIVPKAKSAPIGWRYDYTVKKFYEKDGKRTFIEDLRKNEE